jgi:hypothetical protein
VSSVQPVPAERKSIQEVAMVCGVRRVIVLPRRHARRKKKKEKEKEGRMWDRVTYCAWSSNDAFHHIGLCAVTGVR